MENFSLSDVKYLSLFLWLVLIFIVNRLTENGWLLLFLFILIRQEVGHVWGGLGVSRGHRHKILLWVLLRQGFKCLIQSLSGLFTYWRGLESCYLLDFIPYHWTDILSNSSCSFRVAFWSVWFLLEIWEKNVETIWP